MTFIGKRKKLEKTKELQEEMVGVLTAISIVSKRLASRLMALEHKDEKENEADHPLGSRGERDDEQTNDKD